jgi:hypothetical protein
MRFSLIFSALSALALTACAQPTRPPENLSNSCEEPRPQVCTMIFAPVCATHNDGRQQTHASACNACADDSVGTYINGSCEEGSAL